MFNINQGFSLKSAQFNFERDYFKDLATLKAADLSWFPNYFITNVAGTLYQLDKNSTGDKWRKFSATSDAVSSSLTDLIDRVDKAESNISNNNNDISLLKEDVTDIIATLDEKVTKVNGKGLSTNDYTTDEKNKLAGLSNYTHPTSAAGAKTSGLYKIATDANGHVTAATAVQKSDITALGIPGQDTDTHWTTGLKVGASSTATANAAATNGSVFLNVMDNTSVRDSHMIIGSGSTDVTSDVNGRIIITSTDTTYSAATSSAPGLMPAADKKKVDSLPNIIVTDADVDISSDQIDFSFNTVELKNGVYSAGSHGFTINSADDDNAGFMSAEDYTRLKDVTAGATADSAIDTADITSLLSTKLGV